MTKIRDYKKLAEDILQNVGGADNLNAFSRCATRLRLMLKKIPPQAEENIKAMPGVITVRISAGQFQIVIGTHVADVYDAFCDLVPSDLAQDKQQDNRRILDRIIATMSAVFAPIVFVLAAAGILQGLLIIAKLFSGSFEQTGTFLVLNFMSWTPFVFLPILIAVSSSIHFKCNTYIAILCCCALVNPDWAAIAARIKDGELITFLGLPLSQTVYTATVLPPLFLVWALSILQKWVEKTLPAVVSPLFTPLICMLIMVPLTFILIGPASAHAANGIANGYNWLFNAFPPLAAAVIGGFWQVIVIFGVHWGITPVIMANFDMYNRDSFQAFQTIAVVGQMAAAFACALKSKNQQLKTTGYSAGITGFFGITEPAIYGVNLRLKKPFICGCVAASIGAIVTSLFGSHYYTYAGLPGLMTIINALIPSDPTSHESIMSFTGELLGCLVTIILAFVFIYFLGFDDPKEEVALESNLSESHPTHTTTESESLSSQGVHELELLSPVSGKLVPLEQVNDESFSEKLLGDGVAIIPSENVIVSPCNATIASVISSQHAIGLLAENGAELLIHVGLDTVNLQGKFFNAVVKEGDQVKAGDPLLYFEKENIEQAGYDLTTPILVVNNDEFKLNVIPEQSDIQHGQPLIMLSTH